MRVQRTVFLLAAFFVLPAARQVHAQNQFPRTARIDSAFAAWNSTTSPGCAVGISEGGRITMSRAYGMADLEHDVPNTPTTIFEAGSVS